MHIGIFTYRQKPYISANTAIAYQVAKQIRDDFGCQITLIGIGQAEEQRFIKDYDGIPIRHINDNYKAPTSNRVKEKAKQYFGRYLFTKEARALRNIIIEEKIDALVCVIAPIDSAYIVHRANLKIPVLLYQLDPFYNVGDTTNEIYRKHFVKLINYVSWLFTTDLLYSKYQSDDLISQFKEKISVLKFPKLINNDFSAKTNIHKPDDGNIRILYGGTLYRHIRNHKILLNLKASLPQNCEIVFCGNCDFPDDQKELKECGIICKGYCTQEALAEEVSKADFLINIGNTVKNQLGSKLIEYIATGKPIINITQIDDCPTVPVLQNYLNSITINIENIHNDDTKLQLDKFIQNNIGKIDSWVDIKRNYYEYTPEYVSREIMMKIKSII